MVEAKSTTITIHDVEAAAMQAVAETVGTSDRGKYKEFMASYRAGETERKQLSLSFMRQLEA